jgi:hypothetical protein
MLRAYFDAGMKFKPRRVFYIAGYVGFPNDWTIFNRKWRAFLRVNELPFFHMTDYVARKGYYKGLTEKKRLAVMKRIVAVASENPLLGMAATLLPDDYDRLPEEDRELHPDRYGLCLIACLAKTTRMLQRQRIADNVEYVFELGDEGQGTTKSVVEEVFAKPAKRKKFRFHSLRFAEKTEFPGLQLSGQSGCFRKPLRQEVRDESSGQGARAGPKGTGAVARAPPPRAGNAGPLATSVRAPSDQPLSAALPSGLCLPSYHPASPRERPEKPAPLPASVTLTGKGAWRGANSAGCASQWG